ncbi:glycosyltransferase family 25 protein [Luteibacter sp. 22Crub2.1]|uniref:glycosyltransferase family 25 protein n=1 Tax=Luteibacter sp. 22Crub2.1 TaxID=1283288 RepID=UPI0009A6C275|nr:glycosyltransferase family 25 protein [Luteibacter sp. 22Crub2.1]SKB76963.1 Glycosyltransferase involved in LPS biosynthesis, GR25 family [Luteibacter sp. 22Crub2.1]
MEDLPRFTFVINLAGAHDRWHAVDKSHALYLRPEVELRRIEAVNAQDIDRLRVRGTISVSERACFMSHLRALDIAANEGPGPYWIAEDDVAFGPSTLPLIKSLLERLRGASWDIVLTDVIVARAPDMLGLWMRRRALPPGSGPETFGLDRIAFGGMTSYLVHPRAVPRIRRLMRLSAALNLPWDLWIRAMARRQQLACFATLPFLTRASESPSQIRGEEMHMAWWGVFRDLMF